MELDEDLAPAVGERPPEDDGDEESEVQEEPCLEVIDEEHQNALLQNLNMMRKNRHFCDVVLYVDNAEFHAHRAVLASVSPHLCEAFAAEEEHQGKVSLTFRLNGSIDKKALELLVDYAYTAKLQVPANQVRAVYLAARQLKMERVAKECGRHLARCLSVDNCVEVRALPGLGRDQKLAKKVDEFIAANFGEVSRSAALLGLRRARVEVLSPTRQEMARASPAHLCQLVLDWARSLGAAGAALLSDDSTHMLYLAADNSLQDCSGLPAGDVQDSDLVRDYKKMSLQLRGTRPGQGQPSRTKAIRDLGEAVYEPEHNVIASLRVSDTSLVALVTLCGRLATLSIQLRLNEAARETPTEPMPGDQQLGRYTALATLPSGRCAAGCMALADGSIVMCGGYDRTKCLRTVEQYMPQVNEWRSLAAMREERGRFQATEMNGYIYAVGGSNGNTELDTVECLEGISAKKWSKKARLPLARSYPAVCALDGEVFCIGGWSGHSGTKQVHRYDPAADTWTSCKSLSVGRYQAGSCAYRGLLYAVGGCDSWNCLSSIEIYDPRADSWSFGKPLMLARRGCGLALFKGRLYAVGGSDGAHMLNSVEMLDPETGKWTVGPNLSVPRANVAVAVSNNRLYAIGGFSGKHFLTTMEYLDVDSNEWTLSVPMADDHQWDQTLE